MSVRPASIEAYERIIEDGLLSKRRLETYSALFQFGPATASELCVAMRASGKFLNPHQTNVCTRLGELRDLGAAFELETRICKVTGFNVTVYEVTGDLPRASWEIKKSITSRKLIQMLAELVEEPYCAINTRIDLSDKWQEWSKKVENALELARKYREH